MSAPARFVFDAPVQRLRAGDRIIRSAEPRLEGETVVYVRSSPGTAAPVAFRPVAVVTTRGERGEAAPELGWGARVIIERTPEPDEAYHVSQDEPIHAPGVTLEAQALTSLAVDVDEWDNEYDTSPHPPTAGRVIANLVRGHEFVDAATSRGELIELLWYVDGHRVESPYEQSGREAADLFTAHTVRLHPSGMDAGETCPQCGRIVSWIDHLPPTERGEFVRCHAATRRALP